MQMKNLSIGLKFAAGFGAVLFLLAIVALWSIFGIRGIVGNAEEVIEGNKLRGEIIQKEVDHLNWISKVNTLLTDETETKLTVQTDDHKCGFGKWLYGEGRTHAEELLPELKGLLKELEEPHHHLHASAIDIGKVFKQADSTLPGILAARTIDHLNWANNIRDTFLENKEKLKVQTDPSKCALGRWLSLEKASRAYENGSSDFKFEWEQMVQNHAKLHHSAEEIEKEYAQVHGGLEELLLKRLIDHKNWAEKVSLAIIKGNSNLGVSTDPDLCAYGKFINSDKLAEMMKGFPELRQAVEDSKEPHKKLHKSAIAISRALKSGKRAQAEKNFNDKTITALNQVAECFHRAISAERELGKAQLTAKNTFEQTTMPLLHKTLGHLKKLKNEAEKQLEGMNEANRIFTVKTQPNLEKVQGLLGKVRDKILENVMTDEEMLAAASRTNTAVIICSFISFVVGILVAFFMGRSITRPLAETVIMLNEMGNGHLDKRLNMERGDEIGQMAATMDKFADNLQDEMVGALNKLAVGDLTFEANPKDEKDVIGTALKKTGDDLNLLIAELRSSTQQIATGANQVSDSSQSLSQGATEQAASLEQITSSMTEMAAQIKTNAENAGIANQLSMQGRDAAEKGNNQMEDMMAAMEEINKSGQNISKIIKVIDEIAFQTNLLALNAAVEAARAGRHGKGFAVVAEEVRNLAARSATAAKETAELIEGSVKKAENGTEIASQTRTALVEIVASVTKVTDLVGEIAAASNEQAQGISQVNQGLGQIDQVTQQNTANAEESAAAAEELSSQGTHLQELMSKFKIRITGRPAFQQASEVSSASKEGQAMIPDHAWGSSQVSQQSLPQKPGENISLDDNEFGKY
jgi:methyl-accepting chemotaxis protein